MKQIFEHVDDQINGIQQSTDRQIDSLKLAIQKISQQLQYANKQLATLKNTSRQQQQQILNLERRIRGIRDGE